MSVADKLTKLAENTQTLIENKKELETQISDLADDLSTLQTEHSALEAACDATSDAINIQLGTSDAIDAKDFPDKVTEVYDKGRGDEYDAFWDKYQTNGKRVDYRYSFSGVSWNDELFQPKYPCKPTSANGMFRQTFIKNGLYEHADMFDFSSAAGDQWFSYSQFVKLPVIDFRSQWATMSYMFGVNSYLEYIEKIVSKKSLAWSNAFINCPKLTYVRFEGVIGTSISFSDSPLDTDSMKSVISCLENYSGTESEGVYTLTLKDECKTALEEEGATSPNGNLWTEYVSDLGWVLA